MFTFQVRKASNALFNVDEDMTAEKEREVVGAAALAGTYPFVTSHTTFVRPLSPTSPYRSLTLLRFSLHFWTKSRRSSRCFGLRCSVQLPR